VYNPVVLIVPVELLPPTIPSTLQVTPPPAATVAENCCVCSSVSGAVLGDTVTPVAPATATMADAELGPPPGPVHASVKILVTVIAPVEAVPFRACGPVQALEALLEAVQEVAFVVAQVKVEVPFTVTLAGETVSETVGG